MNTNYSNEWMGENFLPSLYTYWQRKSTDENPWVFISDKQYNCCQKYLTNITDYLQSYTWYDKKFLVKTVTSKKGTFYLVSFESMISESLESLSRYFLSKISSSNANKYYNIFMEILEDCETDLESENMINAEYRKTVNDLYTVCTNTLTKIHNQFGI